MNMTAFDKHYRAGVDERIIIFPPGMAMDDQISDKQTILINLYKVNPKAFNKF